MGSQTIDFGTEPQGKNVQKSFRNLTAGVIVLGPSTQLTKYGPKPSISVLNRKGKICPGNFPKFDRRSDRFGPQHTNHKIWSQTIDFGTEPQREKYVQKSFRNLTAGTIVLGPSTQSTKYGPK